MNPNQNQNSQEMTQFLPLIWAPSGIIYGTLEHVIEEAIK